MSDYGPQDTSTTTLGANQFPISEAWTPNAGFSAVEGGPQSTDAGGKKSAPVSVYAKDGSNLTQGAQADPAYTDGTGVASGTGMGLFKGIFVKLAAIATAIAGTLKVKGDFTEVAGQGTGVVNGINTDLFAWIDVSAYKWFTVQTTGTWTGTLTVQASGDGSTPVATWGYNANSGTLLQTITSNNLFIAPVPARWLRVRMTAFTSNASLVGTLGLFTTPPPPMAMLASQNGTWTVQPGNTANTTPWLVSQSTSATGTKTNVASSATSVTILASNASRKGAMIYNDSTQVLYLDLSGGTASNASYSVQVQPNGFFELPGPAIYTGLITGIWAAANGNGRISEFS